jgi:hypothetical protein
MPLAAYLPATPVEDGYYLFSRVVPANIKKQHLPIACIQ